MKELSIEEKAKRYDKALEKARQLCAYPTSKPFISDLQDLFPELKESEGREIRNWLIGYFQQYKSDGVVKFANGLKIDSIIAWLEKQSKQSSNILWHDVSEEPEEQREIFCEWKWNDGVWHDVVFYHADTKNFWDGEQKIEGVIKWTYVNEMLGKQVEQKHVDKIEPKFHEGDWVVTDKGDTVQIGTVNNDYYTIGNGMLFSMPYVDTSWHLWTIKDAKDGDALVSANNQPFIYNGKYTDSTIGAHIGISYDGKEVFIAEGYNWTANKDVKPATKEQCDFLFQRIKEDGYEWNADEKVVNKVIIYE